MTAVFIMLLVAAFVGMAIHSSAMKKQRDTYAAAAKLNAETLKRWKAAYEQEKQLRGELASEIADIQTKSSEVRNQVNEIIAKDEAANAWANQPIPDSLRNATRH